MPAPRPVPRPLPPSVLELPVAGYGFPPTSFGRLLADDLTLVVFLRHHG